MTTAARAETWLPLGIAAAYWIAMYPGLFGEDSLITLEQARSGNITVWFTAWWVYLISALTIGTRVIPLLTLAGVLVLCWSIREWATAVCPPGRARTWAIAILCASPMVGGLGIQVRHDAWMTAGFLFILAVMARWSARAARPIDYLYLGAAVLLIPTRHNGLGTLIAAALLGMFLLGRHKRRFAVTLAIVAIGVFAVTQAATRAAGRSHSIDPVQAVEWMMADISCMATDPAVQVTDDEWRALEAIADRADWAQPIACRFVSPILIAPTFKPDAVEANTGALARTWWSLGRRYPLELTYVHLRRVNLFLPPFVGGVPQLTQTPFIHSTILPNDFGLTFAFPAIAELVRQPMRAWNAMRAVLANAAIWLIVLIVIAWKRLDLRERLLPSVAACLALEIGLLATAPIAEGRYGLLILITGQFALAYVALDRRASDRATA